MIFDRIELGTYMIACSLLAKKNMIIDKIDPKIVKSEINILRSIGVKIIINIYQFYLNFYSKKFHTIPNRIIASL